MDQPDFGLAREFLLNDKDPMLQHYYDYMVDITVIFGANVTTAPYELLDVLNFERALANVSHSRFDFLFLLSIFENVSFFVKDFLASRGAA